MRRSLPWHRLLLFSLVTMVGLLVMLELALWACGIQPASSTRDPYAGFSAFNPHFGLEKDANGVEQVVVLPTRRDVFNPIQFPTRKPPGSYRIICLGGSSTYGRPFFDQTSFPGWLRAFLPAADPSRTWEVINAGAISYASYRVTSVMEELARFEPDLFIIDVGHNEFLERRTYAQVLETPSVLRDLAGMVTRTRTAGVLQAALRAAGALPSAASMRPRSLMGDEVVRIPINAVGPEAYTRDDRFRREVLDHFRAGLNRMAEIAGHARAEMILITPASNLRDFVPFKSEHAPGLAADERREWSRDFARGLAFLEKGEPAAALKAFAAAERVDDRHAELLFRMAQAQSALGDNDSARTNWTRARDEDIVPLRALSETCEIVRAVARQRGLGLVDFERTLGERTDPFAPGDDFFYDHVHMNIEGNRQLALAVIQRLAEQGVVSPSSAWGPQAIAEVSQRVDQAIDRPRCARELEVLASAMDILKQPRMAEVCRRDAARLSTGSTMLPK